MTDKKNQTGTIHVEPVNNWRELVVTFLARAVALTDDERKKIEEALPEDGKERATVSMLHKNLRAGGHDELAEKIEPFMLEGTFGPIFDNANMKVKMSVRDEAPNFFMDEAHLLHDPGASKGFNRLRMRNTFVSGLGGWAIGEEYDDRYDTEVGGNHLLVSQSINEQGEIEGGLPTSMSMDELAAIPKRPTPPQIVDYQEDKRYTLEEAEGIEELAPVVQRLKERIAEYDAKLAEKTSWKIAEAYQRDLEKPELKAFKEVSRYSRKYGFPVVCTLGDKSEEEQLHWAACLLLEVAGAWPREDIPKQLTFERGTALFNDAQQLLANGLGNARQVSGG